VRRRLSRVFYELTSLLTRVVVRTFGRVEVEGREHLPAEGPIVLVANHLHLLDPPLVSALVPRWVHTMAKRELFETPLIGWIFWAYGAFPVRRYSSDMGALRVARNYLRNGDVVLMFPEGTRSHGEGIQPALPGAAMVALLAKAPLIPVAITGTEDIDVPSVFFRWIVRRRPRVRVRFGEPFELGAEDANARNAEVSTDLMMRRVAELLPERYRGVYGEETAGTIVVARYSRATDGE
jgi:1-acyl-sn-glycerol-3-phosphate acyltransferase